MNLQDKNSAVELMAAFDNEFGKTYTLFMALMQKLILAHARRSEPQILDWRYVKDLQQVQKLLVEALDVTPELKINLDEMMKNFLAETENE